MLDADRPVLDVSVRPDATPGSGRMVRLRGGILPGHLRLPGAYRWPKLTVVSLLILNGLFSLITNLAVLVSDEVYAKDFIQEYLLIKAIIHGHNPYLPINQLSQAYLGDLPPTAFPFDHPTPHPASIGIVLLPLGGLDYASAAAVWFGVEVAALAGTVLLLTRTDGVGLSWWKWLLIVIGLIGWPPVRRELLLGQPMPLIAFLIAAARAALFSSRPALAGASIGVALLLKPITWLMLLALLLRRRFDVLGGAAIALLTGALVSMAAVGSTTIFVYATEVLPSVSAQYLPTGVNISIPALVWRVFRGTDSYARGEFFTPASITAPASLAMIVSVLLQLAIVLVLVYMVRVASSTDQALSIAVCLSIMINPIAWGTYIVLAIIPLWQVVRSLSYQRYPIRETCLATLAFILLSLPITFWILMAQVLADVRPTPGSPVEIPALVSFLTFAPDLALALLAWLVLKCSPPAVLRSADGLR
jgi:hypothetical protein